jgi:hypothetical protein
MPQCIAASACFWNAAEGTTIAAASEVFWGGAAACGDRYVVTCTGATNQGVPHPCTGRSVTVKIVDLCPAGCRGTIDLSQEAFAVIADPDAGKIQIEYTKYVRPSSLVCVCIIAARRMLSRRASASASLLQHVHNLLFPPFQIIRYFIISIFRHTYI